MLLIKNIYPTKCFFDALTKKRGINKKVIQDIID